MKFINDSTFDNNSTEAVQPNWQIRWTVSSGERLFSSVMPVRPYDWEQSFKFRWYVLGLALVVLCGCVLRFVRHENCVHRL